MGGVSKMNSIESEILNQEGVVVFSFFFNRRMLSRTKSDFSIRKKTKIKSHNGIVEKVWLVLGPIKF